MRRATVLSVMAVATPLVLAGCGEQHAGLTTAAHGETVAASAAPQAPRKIFGVVKPGQRPDTVLLAEATRRQPGGPETVVPANVRPARQVPLAPGATIRITAPLYEGDLQDWLKGVQVTPDQFARMSAAAERHFGPFPGRARMFDVWLDGQGRVTGLQQIFSP